jgi:hypothetical protein
MKKPEAKNIVTLPLTVELTVLCVDSITEAIRNFKKCFTTPNKTLGGEGPQTDKYLPPSTFTGQFLGQTDIKSLWCLYRYLVHGPIYHLCYDVSW